jgi:hypothetical protein
MAGPSHLLSHFIFIAARELREEAGCREPGQAHLLFHLARHVAQLVALFEDFDARHRERLGEVEREARSWSAAAIARDLPGFRLEALRWEEAVAAHMEREGLPQHETPERVAELRLSA